MKRQNLGHAIRQQVQDAKDEKLREQVWNGAKRDCPFRYNRGYDPEDPRCFRCPEAGSDPQAGCLYETQTRLLAIRNRLFQDTCITETDEWEQEWPDNDLYLDFAHGKTLTHQEIKDFHFEIREIAQFLISEYEIGGWVDEWYIDLEKHIHPNTLEFFRNCFPEWNKFEKGLERRELYNSMHLFHEKEQDKAFTFPAYQQQDEDADNVQELLILSGNWRGYPFEKLFDQDGAIPRKTIQAFTRDYFKDQENRIKRQKAIAKERGLFGQKTEEERWPMKWMINQDNATIKNFMHSNKGKFFCELMRYMELNRMKKHEGEQIAKKLNASGNSYIVVQINRKTAAKALKSKSDLKNIKVSDQKIYAFLKWMVKHDLIKELGKPGKNEYTVYAIGKWTSYPDPETGEMKPGQKSFFVKQKNRQNLKNAVECQIW